jgi:dTMP kinase
MQNTIYVAIEGCDKMGKATQAQLLAETLIQYGNLTVLVEIPRRSTITGDIIYWMLGNGLANKLPSLFQLAHSLNRFQFQTFELFTGYFDYIIFDRWTSSSIAYGLATKVPEWLLNLFKYPLIVPDLVIVLTGKKFSRGSDDSYEADTELQKSVSEKYSHLVNTKDNHVEISNLNADGTMKSEFDVHKDIVQVMLDRGLFNPGEYEDD